MDSVLTQFSRGIASVGERVLPAVVQIRNGRAGAGAGIIWQSDGLLVTNAHVVNNRRVSQPALTVQLADGREFTPRLLAVDSEADLAVLRIDAHDLPAIELGSSQQLKPGELVFAFGFPWGVAGGATAGVVIGVGAQVGDMVSTRNEWIAASLHLRPGHSGGPMVDAQGRLRLAGRASDVMKSGGYRVHPAEIEMVLEEAGQGRAICVLGLASDYWGEVIIAVADGLDSGWEAAALPLVEQLARHKRPRAWLTLPELPRNAQGKVVRARVRDAVLERWRLEDGPHPRLMPAHAGKDE